jgi:hypothetical protein
MSTIDHPNTIMSTNEQRVMFLTIVVVWWNKNKRISAHPKICQAYVAFFLSWEVCYKLVDWSYLLWALWDLSLQLCTTHAWNSEKWSSWISWICYGPLFHRCVYAIFKQPSVPEGFDKFIERGSYYLKHLDILYIVGVVDVVQICNPLLI